MMLKLTNTDHQWVTMALLTRDFITASQKSGAYDCTEAQIKEVAKVFIRKYTNAKLGGKTDLQTSKVLKEKNGRMVKS